MATRTRVPIIRRDADGTIIDGTAAFDVSLSGRATLHDFRDLSGKALDLPPGSSFEGVLDLEHADGVEDLETFPPILDPDSPHWLWARLPKRERREHEALARRALHLYAEGAGRLDDDLDYCRLQATWWGRSVRQWRRNLVVWWVLIVIAIGMLLFDLANHFWIFVGLEAAFLGSGVVMQRRTREQRRDAQRELAYYREQVKALSESGEEPPCP